LSRAQSTKSGVSWLRQARSTSDTQYLQRTLHDVSHPVASTKEDAQSEALVWVLRERRERDEESTVEVEDLGAEIEKPLFLPTPAFMASAVEE
jgi:hypothetical protein